MASTVTFTEHQIIFQFPLCRYKWDYNANAFDNDIVGGLYEITFLIFVGCVILNDLNCIMNGQPYNYTISTADINGIKKTMSSAIRKLCIRRSINNL